MLFKSKLVVLGSSLLACGVFAQPDSPKETILTGTRTSVKADPTTAQPVQSSLSQVFEQILEQEPLRRAGLRASVLRQSQVVPAMVVIVESADDYLFAISQWESVVRFPILWDDGTTQSHEDIARFVRAFKPEHVIELSGDVGSSWMGTREEKQAIFDDVFGKAIDQKTSNWKQTLDQLASTGIISPGIVITDVDDSAWAGALALCAGRFQPIAFVTKPKSPMHKPMDGAHADQLERTIERAAKDTGRSWEGVGDDIDAITLALNVGTMIQAGPERKDRLATSDRIGRKDSNGRGTQWAWCGQIIGNESRSVYQAMCALFLSIDQATVWDGYSAEQPWATYDGTEAGEILRKAKIDAEVTDLPRNTLGDWKLRMVRPIGHGDANEGSSLLFLMNSHGMAHEFNLPSKTKGQGKAGHMPIFEVPAAMHMVHSFSLQKPMNRDTIGGRLIERGVYVYAGSVDEPFLQGFVPTPIVARRLAGTLSFAAAVHFDGGKVWKIAVLGDPLVTFGPAGRRIEANPGISGAQYLGTRFKDRLKDGDYLGVVEDLSLLGKDEAVVRIASALMKDQPERFSAKIAQASIPAMFRVGEFDGMIEAYDRLNALGKVDPLMQDLLWLSSPYLLSRWIGDESKYTRITALLRSNIRQSQRIDDAEDLAMSMRTRSILDAIGVLESLRPTLNVREKIQLDKALARVRK
ncbi:MAG: hypothetical protein JKX70_02250 [Phycisphaerales bacterium]|nr:hypothetical protein [Phycisphaerales bacterium]